MAGAARKSRSKATGRSNASAFNTRRARASWRAYGFEPIDTATYRKRQIRKVRKAAQRQRADADSDEQMHMRIATYRDRDPDRFRSVYDLPTDNSSDDYIGGLDNSDTSDPPDDAAKQAASYRRDLKQRMRAAQIDAAYFQAQLDNATGKKGDAIDLTANPRAGRGKRRRKAPSPDTASPASAGRSGGIGKALG